MTTTPDETAPALERYRARFLMDLIQQGTAAYWERRAQIFEQARPQPGDWHGGATADQLAEMDRRCADTAKACRQHAQVLRSHHPAGVDPLVWDALHEAQGHTA